MAPTPEDIQHRMQALAAAIAYHDRLYYDVATPELTDAEYDALVAELAALEREYPQWVSADSPLARVGGQASPQLAPVTFDTPVLSLQNTHSREELGEFVRRVEQGLGAPARFTGELKIDGLTVVLSYHQGRLLRAATRGDGHVGEDVTANVRTIAAVPDTLAAPVSVEVRGEVYLARSQFAALNASRTQAGLAVFANPRNAAAGSLRQLDADITRQRALSAFFYQIRRADVELDTQHQVLEQLAAWGLPVDPHWRVCEDLAAMWEYVQMWQMARADLDFDTDGLVFKLDQLAAYAQLGATHKAPRWATAFKFPPEEALTEVRAIELSVGRTGALTPTAELAPVRLAGTQVSRASLHNADNIERLDVRVGDFVFVRKAGEIIPEVVRVEPSLRPPGTQPFAFPSHCPACGGEVWRAPDEAAYRCLNGMACPAQIRESLIHFASRRAMDIDGLGEKTVDLLLETGRVHTVADLYRLSLADLMALPRFGALSAERLGKGIATSRERPLSRLLFGLGIRFVGERIAALLARHFGTMSALRHASVEALQSVEEIGERIAQSVTQFFAQTRNTAILDELAALGVNMVEPEVAGHATSGPLAGQTVVVTGTLPNLSRHQAQTVVAALGGRVVNSVSRHTNLIIVGDNPGSKQAKAAELGIPQWDAQEFWRQLRSAGWDADHLPEVGGP